MMDSTSVISQATHGIVKELAEDYEVSGSRMYEILGKDNPYPKARKLIRRIARHNQEGARLIKADLDWGCSGHCDPTGCTVTISGCSIWWAYPCDGTCVGNTKGCIQRQRGFNEG